MQFKEYFRQQELLLELANSGFFTRLKNWVQKTEVKYLHDSLDKIMAVVTKAYKVGWPTLIGMLPTEPYLYGDISPWELVITAIIGQIGLNKSADFIDGMRKAVRYSKDKGEGMYLWRQLKSGFEEAKKKGLI